MNISKDIKYNTISENEFKTFLDVLKKIDLEQYKLEGQDGFLDLYNYWDTKPKRNFNEKLIKNIKRIS